MAKKTNDRKPISPDDELWIVYSTMLAEATWKATDVWNTIREFSEDEKRMLTEREVVHLRALLYMIKETFEEVSVIAQKYNADHVKEIKKLHVVPFHTGAIDVQDDKAKKL